VPFLIPDDYWRRTLAGWRGRRVTVGVTESAGATETLVGELTELRSTALVLAGPEPAQVIPYRHIRSVEAASEREEVSQCRTEPMPNRWWCPRCDRGFRNSHGYCPHCGAAGDPS
jgi:hypothetical protein